MADSTPKPVEQPVKEAILDWKAAETHLAELKKKIFEYEGKAGHNPHIWWKEKGALDSEKRLAKGLKTPDVYHGIMALKFSVPTI